jgi:hypothetical protein
MRSYESKFFGVRMHLPDSWKTQTWSDEGMDKFARDAAAWKPGNSTSICFHAIKPLVSTQLDSPGATLTDAAVDFKACVQTDKCFMEPHNGKQLKELNLNGIRILYHDDFNAGSPENMYYRFPRWRFSPGLWLYASVYASGRSRFECAWSVFATLAPLTSKPRVKSKPLFCRKPWNVTPTLFRMTKAIRDDAPLFDLSVDPELSEEALNANQGILSGRQGASTKKWTPMAMRRKSRVRSLDCYYGPNSVFSSGIFSSRAVESLRPYFSSGFLWLPCDVNGKPHYFVTFNNTKTCLDAKNSEISRFDDGSIMNIKRYRFNEERVADPQLFGIPEERHGIFATASIPTLVSKAGLTGIDFHPLNGNGREYTCPG